MKPIIIDNFLPDLMHKHIQKDIELIEYNMLTNVSGVKDKDIEIPNVNIVDNQLGLGKVIYDGGKGPIELERFPLYSVMLDYLEDSFELKIRKLFRMRIGISINVNKEGSHFPHVDFNFPHNTLLYYVNDCDGDTIFYEEFYNGSHPRKYNISMTNKPKANQAVLFNGLQYHSSSNPTNTPYRAAININFE